MPNRIIMSCVLVAALAWLAAPLSAQEAGGEAEAAAGAESESAAQSEEDRLAELLGADEEGESGDYEQEEEDDFVPTQEVSSDQSVNFPVDI